MYLSQRSAVPRHIGSRHTLAFTRGLTCPLGARGRFRYDPQSSGSPRRQSRTNYRVDGAPERVFEALPLNLPAADVQLFQRASTAWQQLCTQGAPKPPNVASQHSGPAPAGVAAAHFDVVVVGGTLGILLATALLAQQAGSTDSNGRNSRQQQLRVAVVERGVLAGRDQEWNCTQADLQVLVDLGVLTASEVCEVVVTHIPAVRVGVAGGAELTLTGVMDAGVSPNKLLGVVKRRFLELGGQLLEHTAFQQLSVYDDAAHLQLTAQHTAGTQQLMQAAAVTASTTGEAAAGAGGRQATFQTTTTANATGSSLVVSCGVVVDALGSFSPLSAQVRGAAAPEAAMLLVGSCVDAPQTTAAAAAEAGGKLSTTAAAADVLWGKSPIDRLTCQQYWWERFPAAGGSALTTYMFTFTDPAADNKDLMRHMVERYGQGLGDYLGVAPESLSVRRGVCGFVPCYSERVVPLVDRLLPVGDSAANRSALSLAGFCALLRHLGRLTHGLREAMEVGALTKQELSLLQPWCPGVTATTAMQRTMSVYSSQFSKIKEAADAAAPVAPAAGDGPLDSAVLSIMSASFAAMWDAVGEQGMRPFVADRIQLAPLAASMATQLRRDARQLLAYSAFLGDTRGASRLMTGLAGLWLYGLLHATTPLTSPLHEALLAASPRLRYRWHRYTDAWRYGSGNDWVDSTAQQQAAGAGPAAAPTAAVGSSRGPKAAAAVATVAGSCSRGGLSWGSSSSNWSACSRFVSRAAATGGGRHWTRPRGSVAAAAAGGRDGISWQAEDLELLLDGRLDKCDLVDAFSRAAIQQQGRPRENVYSYTEPQPLSSTKASRPAFPAWCEAMQSLDSHEVIDWSDTENDGWGMAAEPHTGSSTAGYDSSSSASSSGHPPAAAAAAATLRGGQSGPCQRSLSGGLAAAACSGSSSRVVVWGGSFCCHSSSVAPRVGSAAAAGSRAVRRAVAVCATPGGSSSSTGADKPDAEVDDAPHYEGADSDTLFPPGSLELDDPGHPTELSGQGGKDMQAAVTRPEAKPYMNIVRGKWVPPSKAEAERMMGQLSQMGPDEGV